MFQHIVVEEPNCVDKLRQTLQSGEDTVRVAALRRVTRDHMHANPDILVDVRIALVSPSATVRCAALRCWQRTGMGSDSDVRSSLLHRDREVRIAALIAIAGWSSDDGINACRIALRDAHDDVIRVSLQLVHTHALAVEHEVLAAHLGHANPEIACTVAVILAQRGNPTAFQMVEDWLVAGDSPSQRFAVREVGRIGVTVYVHHIRALLHPQHPCLGAAILALSRLGDRTSLRPLLSFLCHVRDDIRAEAVRALIHIGDVSIAPALHGALADERLYVRTAALHVLIGLDLPFDTAVLAGILPYMLQAAGGALLRPWLTGSAHIVATRLLILHRETQWYQISESRYAMRCIIAAHPQAADILHALACVEDARIVATLLPFYIAGDLQLPSDTFLIALLAGGTVQHGTSLRPLADAYIQRHPQTMRAFWQVADATFRQYYGELCILTFAEQWHALLWQITSRELHGRYVRVLASLIPIAPGYIARMPVAAIAWIEAGTEWCSLNDRGYAHCVVEAWRLFQHSDAVLPPIVDIYRDADFVRAFWGHNPSRIVHRMTELHRNPLVCVDLAMRNAFRTVLATHPDGMTICKELHDAKLPSLAVTLLPWYCDGTLPCPDEALLRAVAPHCDASELLQFAELQPRP